MAKNIGTNLAKLWREFWRTRQPETLNQICEQYLPLVRYVAKGLHKRLPPGQEEFGDLVNVGYLGLRDAVERCDSGSNGFKVFAAEKIRGAILDHFRRLDRKTSRLARQKRRRLEAARTELWSAKGEMPSEDDVRQALGLNAPQFRAFVAHAATVDRRWFQLSTEHQCDRSKGEYEWANVVDRGQADPLQLLTSKDEFALLLRGLNRHERLIISLYYHAGFNFEEISRAVGLSSSRVSQIHTDTLARIKLSVLSRHPEFASL